MNARKVYKFPGSDRVLETDSDGAEQTQGKGVAEAFDDRRSTTAAESSGDWAVGT